MIPLPRPPNRPIVRSSWLKTPLSESAMTMARIMQGSASRMLALIDDVLDLARGRLGGGLAVHRSGEEPLEPVLWAVIAELSASHPDRIVEASLALAEPVNYDRTRIAQLFSNLLSNALIYGSHDKPVRVSASSNPVIFELSVANAGDPIPSAALEHLFKPFYRSAVLRHREGLGLGLYIADQIARAHGGTLSVVSTPEETNFTFRMPNHV